MAVVKMKKFRVVGLSSEKDKIIGTLLRCGSAELKPTKEIDLTVRSLDGEALEDATSDYSRAVVALEFLKAQKKRAKDLAKAKEIPEDAVPKEGFSLFFYKNDVGADEFENVVLERGEILGTCAALEAIAARQSEIKSQRNALATLKEGVEPYAGLTLKFSQLGGTKHVSFVLGTCKDSKTIEGDVEEIGKRCGADVQLMPCENGKGKQAYVLFGVTPREDRQMLESELAAVGYSPCTYDFDCTAKEKLEEIGKEDEALAAEDVSLVLKSLEYVPQEPRLKLFSDNSKFRAEIVRADGEFAKTSETFILECFVPEPEEARTKEKLLSATENIELTVEDVEPEDKPPTLLKNNAVVAPYEFITNTYSPPSYYETDPNPFMAVFYFIYFGIMLGDAGYGLLLAIATFLLAKFCKMGKNTKSMMLIFGMGGISGIIWGLLFGGIFSIEAIEPLWFSPVDEPILMLVLCFALGLAQIFVGMGINAYNLIKEGHLADAVYDIFSWYVIFLGAGLAVLSAMVLPQLPIAVGLVILAVGVAVLMFGGAIRGKGVFGRIIGAVQPLYGVVNYFSDVMSYSRLFGLCLASTVIGLVFNTLATVIMEMLPVVGIVFAIIILIIGHVINIAIGLLGIYVHDSRLQFIEFFGRFYRGGGRLFAPLGLNLKYVTIKAQEV